MSHMVTNNGSTPLDGGDVWRRGSWDERELLSNINEADEMHNEANPGGGFADGDLKYVEIDPINQKVVKRFASTIGGGIGLNSSRMSASSFNNPFKIARPIS